MVLFNAQVFEGGEFSQDFNRPSELANIQISACNGHLVCVESDRVALHEKGSFLSSALF